MMMFCRYGYKFCIVFGRGVSQQFIKPMIARDSPLSDVRRQQLRDDRLWVRERERARLFNLKRIHCPCSKCRGRRKLLLATIRDHLIRNGRHPEFRVWRGPGEQDSSDDEWEEEFWRPEERQHAAVDFQVDTHQMVEDAFQQVDNAQTLEERVHEEVASAFVVADDVHDRCSQGDNWDQNISDCGGGDDAVGENDDEGTGEDCNLDPAALEEAIHPLYGRACSTKLAATVLLMNLCIVHGVSNCFADELFTILHGRLLPEENGLPRNYYGAKTLTRRLGLSYNTLHACENGCVLFRGDLANEERCPKCSRSRFKDERRKKFPVKVL
jgi:hypothetical protein